MRFNAEAYEKVFPRETVTPPVETAVPTFTPATDVSVEEPTDIQEGEDNNGNSTADNGSDN